MFVAIALDTMTFGQISWARVVLGALALGCLVAFRRERLPRSPVVYLHFVVIGFTSCTIPHIAFSWSIQFVPSGIAAIYNSVTPLATAVLAVAVFRIERLTVVRMIALLVGIAGVTLIIGPWRISELGTGLVGQIACLVAAISYGFSLVYMRRFVANLDIPALTIAFLNVGAAAVVALGLSPVLLPGRFDFSVLGVICLLALGMVSTGVAHIWNLNVLRGWGPVAVSTVTYLIPVVAVILGVTVLRERLEWNEPVGAIVVLVGVVLARSRVLTTEPPQSS